MSMDDINKNFLDASFISLINNNNITTNIDFITPILAKFIGSDDKTLVDALRKKKKKENKENFKEINIATFKAMRFFIFYKANYDYKDLQKIEQLFYRLLYVSDKLLQLYEADKQEDFYKSCLKKLFAESNKFSRKTSNPLTSKGEEKINSVFDSFQKAFIPYPRVTRARFISDLKPVDTKIKEYIKNKYAAEQQDLKATTGLKKLLQEYSDLKDRSTLTYIKGLLIEGGSNPVVKPKNGVKGRRKSIVGGGIEESVVNYLTGIFELDNKITETTPGNFTVEIAKFVGNYASFNNIILPELASFKNEKLDDKYLLIKEFSKISKSEEYKTVISTYNEYVKSTNGRSQIATDVTAAAAAAAEAAVTEIDKYRHIGTTYTEDNKKLIFDILKTKYDNNKMVMLEKKLSSLF